MPELPEVETIRRQLKPILCGARIKRVVLRTPSILKNCAPEKFQTILNSKIITNILRRGKLLIFDCEGMLMTFHLGMSGIFLLNRSQSPYPQHIHLEFFIEPDKRLYYQDVRKFGKVWIFEHASQLPGLGIDPYDKKFTLNNFKKLLNLRRRNLKLFLMDQSQVAGIGNIYANEILFKARISPSKRTDQLDEREQTALYKAIFHVLEQAISRFGTTYSAYRTATGGRGENQNFLKVYQREGSPCTNCGRPIVRIYLGNRSTFYCPKCQK